MDRLDRIEKNLEFLAQSVAKHDAQLGTLSQLVTQIAEGAAKLLHTAQLHEKQIEAHEKRITHLEE